MKVKVLHAPTQVKITELDLDEILEREEECLVGRSAESYLVLDSSDISRQHGKFFAQDGEIYYADIGSRNGSKINDDIVEVNLNYLLKPGDIIQAGEFALIIDEASDVAEDVTVFRDLDVTVVSPQRFNAEVIDQSPGALVKVTASSVEDVEDNDPKSQTKALFAAINKRVLGELRAAGKLTRDSYLKAVRTARENIENNKLIDPEEFEKETEKYWQSVTNRTSALGSGLGSTAVKRASEVGSRLGSAVAKGASEVRSRFGSATKAAFGAAWKEITAPKSNPESRPNQSLPQEVSHTPEAIISEEKRLPNSEIELKQSASENKLHLTASSENQMKKDKLLED
jgi:hypothetical protein